MAGKHLGELAGGAWNQPDLAARLGDVAAGRGEVQDLPMLLAPPGAPERNLLLSARTLRRPGSAESSVLLAIEDVTARRQAEEERDRFFTLSNDLLCIADADGYLRRVSPAVRDILGWTQEEFMARPFLEFVHPEDHTATLQVVDRMLKAGERVLSFENRYRHKDGRWRVLSWRATPHTDGRMYANARDVTDRRHAEEEILRLNQDLRQRATQLEAINAELEAFSYSVSHDLRAPLRHVEGFAQLLRKHAGTGLDATGLRFVETIVSSSRKLGVLIDELLQFSRLGRSEMKRARVDMRALAEEVWQELQLGDAAGRRIAWRLGDLPVVEGDNALLRQVWRNLLGNAVKYTRNREAAEVEVTGGRDGADGLVFAVRDNGAGFDMKYAAKLFGVFQRLHADREFEGTGVGLANVRRIVQRHGGRTWAEGRPGEGATFHFSLPEAPGAVLSPSTTIPTPDNP